MVKKRQTFKEFLGYWDNTVIQNTYYKLSSLGFNNVDENTKKIVSTTMECMAKERSKILMMYLEFRKGKVKRLMNQCEIGSARRNIFIGAYLALHNIFCDWRGLQDKGSVYEVENGKI